MQTGRHRRALRAAACVALLPLAACTTRGDIYVHSVDRVEVDLTIVAPSDQGIFGYCSGSRFGEGVDAKVVTPRASEEATCRVTGTTTLGDTGGMWGFATSADDTIFARYLPMGSFLFVSTPEAIDVTVHLPGPVLAATGDIVEGGTAVHFHDVDRFLAEGVSITALLSPTPASWLLPAGAGLVWGAALTASVLWWRRGRSGSASRSGASTPSTRTAASVAVTPPAAPAPPDPPQDPSVWASHD